MQRPIRGLCAWCGDKILELTPYIVSVRTPNTLFCGKPCADAAKRREERPKCWRCFDPIEDVAYVSVEMSGVYCGIECLREQGKDWKKYNPKGWISVDERLPDVPYKADANISTSDSVSCLVVFPILSEYGSYFKTVIAMYFPRDRRAWRVRKNDGFPSKDITHKVTHWQPLPEPPPVPKAPGQKQGQCKDCRQWTLDETLGDVPCDRGRCDASNDALLVRTHAGAWGLSNVKERITTSYWGCVQFEPREGEA
jgi:hypothetical protein